MLQTEPKVNFPKSVHQYSLRSHVKPIYPKATPFGRFFSKVLQAMADVVKTAKAYSKVKLEQLYMTFNRRNQREEPSQKLLDNPLVLLNDQQWEKFQAALDAPERELPNLKKLFSEPSVFG